MEAVRRKDYDWLSGRRRRGFALRLEIFGGDAYSHAVHNQALPISVLWACGEASLPL